MNGAPEARFSGRKKKAHGVSRGKAPQQAEQAREAGDRNLAAFSVARFAGLFSPLLPPTAWSPRRLGYQTVARFAGSSGDDFIDILTSTSRTPVDSRA